MQTRIMGSSDNAELYLNAAVIDGTIKTSTILAFDCVVKHPQPRSALHNGANGVNEA